MHNKYEVVNLSFYPLCFVNPNRRRKWRGEARPELVQAKAEEGAQAGRCAQHTAAHPGRERAAEDRQHRLVSQN